MSYSRRFGGFELSRERNRAMLLALPTTFAAGRKQPLTAVLQRIHVAIIIAADFGMAEADPAAPRSLRLPGQL
jgi:hypothetical protein